MSSSHSLHLPSPTPIRDGFHLLADITMELGCWAIFGYLVTPIVTASALGALTGALHLTISYLVSLVVRPIFNRLFFAQGSSQAFHVVGHLLNVVLTAGIASSSAAAFGYAIPLAHSILLCSIQHLVLSFLTNMGFHDRPVYLALFEDL